LGLFDISGKTALLTGASSGLGVQFAKALAGHGADVVIAARRLERLEKLAEEIRQTGRKCLPVQCDVTKTSDIETAVEKTIKEFGKVDILVNNAGVAEVSPAEKHTDEQWDKVMDTNIRGVFLFARTVGSAMIKRNYGKIINIASMYGLVANTYSKNVSYHSSKGAVILLTRALAAEWAEHNITVNAIGPGFFISEMTQGAASDEQFEKFVGFRCPMGRMGRPGELDGALLFLASDASSYVTGQTIFVDGGWTAV
jgi:NAD(P)-dependent dehydrogenase (short-subunit alcohol dehydrogenase family)